MSLNDNQTQLLQNLYNYTPLGFTAEKNCMII